MSSNVLKAAGSTMVGVLWRAGVFGVVVLCFSGLMSLRGWYTSYAPSEVWADAVGQELEWSPVISTAARAMSLAEPNRAYPTEASFYRELLSYIRGTKPKRQKAPEGYQELMNKLDQHSAVQEYRDLRKSRDDTEEDLKQDLKPRAREIVSKSKALRIKNKKIAAKYEEIEHLKNLQDKPPGYEEKIKTAEADLEKLHQQKPLFTEVQALITQRGTIEAGLQRALSNLNSRIKDQEEGIREAFDAASLPARRVNGSLPTGLQTLAMQIGKENDPLHVLYLVAWYGLEAAIVFLLCFVLVPWLIRLFGDASDPNDLRSKITERIKGWLKTFSPTVANSASKVIAVAVAGSIAAAGVTMAAGDQPSIIPPIQHAGSPDSEVRDGKNEREQRSGSNESAELDDEDKQDKQDDGSGNGDDGAPPSNFAELQSTLEQQAALINELQQKLKTVTEDVAANVKSVHDLNTKTEKVRANMATMSAGMGTLHQNMGSLTQNVSSISGGIGGLYAANQSILELSDARNQHVLGSLHRLERGTATTTSDVQKMKATVEQAAQDVPPVASDLLRINAIPGGTWTRINPFHRYEVTEAVTKTVERAMQGADTDQQKEVAAALRQLQDGNKRKYKKLKEDLYAKCSRTAHPTLDQWTPFIAKVSRVQEYRHGKRENPQPKNR